MKIALGILMFFLAAALEPFCAESATWYKDFKPTEDTDYMKTMGGFAAQLQVISDQSFFKDWNKPGSFVSVPTTSHAEVNQPVFTIVLFANPGKGPDGKCHVTADLTIKTPAGKIYGGKKDANIWNGMPPTEENSLQLGVEYMGVTIEPQDPVGQYSVEVLIRDNVKHVSFSLVQHFFVGAAPQVAGQFRPTQFLTASAYEQAKEKILSWIRSENYEVPEKLTQRVSEDLYRLIDYARKEDTSRLEVRADLFELFSVADSVGIQGAGLVASHFAPSGKSIARRTFPPGNFKINFSFPDYHLSFPGSDISLKFPYYFMFFRLRFMNVDGGYDSTRLAILSTGYGKGEDASPSQATLMVAVCKTRDLMGFATVWEKNYGEANTNLDGIRKYGDYWERQMGDIDHGRMKGIMRVQTKNEYSEMISFVGLNGSFKDNLDDFLKLNLP